MPKVKLTIRVLKGLKPDSEKQIDYHDQNLTGFGVRVSPAGKKTFCVFYRVGRRLRRYSIGGYPTLSLADARDEAKRALREAAAGRDPALEKQKAKDTETFGELADLYLKKHASKKRSGREDRRIVEKYLRPGLKHVRARDVTRPKVREILEEVARTGPVMANRVLACIRMMYNWGVANDLVESNPCTGLQRPSAETSRDRVYSEKEMNMLWRAAREERWVVGDLFRLQLLTATRVSEVSKMKWSEIDDRWWTIPAARSMNGLAHRVWLSDPAVRILERLRDRDQARANDKKRKPSEWVFPGRRTGRPVGNIKSSQNRIREATRIKDFQSHDLRRTASTMMMRMGIPASTVGKVLNRVDPGVVSVDDGYGYDNEKRQALDQWAKKLMVIVSDLNQIETK